MPKPISDVNDPSEAQVTTVKVAVYEILDMLGMDMKDKTVGVTRMGHEHSHAPTAPDISASLRTGRVTIDYTLKTVVFE